MTDLVPPPRYRPAILPENRRLLIESSRTILPTILARYVADGRQGILPPAVIRNSTLRAPQAIAATMAEHEAHRLSEAILYYVAPDMTALAISAGTDLPDYPFTGADLPSPYGLMLFDGPLPETYSQPWELFDAPPGSESPAYLCAVAWGPVTDVVPETGEIRPGTWFTLYSDRDMGDRAAIDAGLVDEVSMLTSLQAGYGRSHLTYDNESMIFDGCSWREIANEHPTDDLVARIAAGPEPPPVFLEDRPRVGPRMLRTLLAASLLMREPLARVETDPQEIFTRPERRRLHRQGHDATSVRLVHLRERPHTQARDGEGRQVEWSCRWPVRGHWRNVWYPSEQRHRPRYIAPFLKGPEDKPLRVRETVRVWDR